MKNEVITINGIEKQVPYGILLSETLPKTSEFAMPCAGHGRCGKCKVQVTGSVSEPSQQERLSLTVLELEHNIRLACQTRVLGPCAVLSLESRKNEIVFSRDQVEFPANGTHQPLFQQLGAAVDIGTTTLAVAVYDVSGLVGQEGMVNPQVAFGADVISRIEHSLQGKAETLAELVQSGIKDLLKQVCEKHGRQMEDIDTLVITGNTVMLYLLTGRNPVALSRAPFEADWLAGEWLDGKALDLSCPKAKIYLPHCISAFVGADITMALLSVKINRNQKKRLLVDIGTNGEVVLWTGEKLWCCSTAAGPAFEGTGLSMGMTAKEGAISKVSWADGTFQVTVLGNQKPVGICGSGVIDAVSCLLDSELMDETGFLEDEEVAIGGDVTINQEDIRKIQLAKSAICAGIVSALHQAGMGPEDLEELLVAGGFGSKISLSNAMKIGLLPRMEEEKITVCGNAALAGAQMLLCQKDLLSKELNLVNLSHSLNLATDSYFQDCYMEGMLFEIE